MCSHRVKPDWSKLKPDDKWDELRAFALLVASRMCRNADDVAQTALVHFFAWKRREHALCTRKQARGAVRKIVKSIVHKQLRPNGRRKPKLFGPSSGRPSDVESLPAQSDGGNPLELAARHEQSSAAVAGLAGLSSVEHALIYGTCEGHATARGLGACEHMSEATMSRRRHQAVEQLRRWVKQSAE